MLHASGVGLRIRPLAVGQQLAHARGAGLQAAQQRLHAAGGQGPAAARAGCIGARRAVGPHEGDEERITRSCRPGLVGDLVCGGHSGTSGRQAAKGSGDKR